MEVAITDQGTFELVYDKMDVIIHLLALGFTVAIVVAVVIGGARLGWKHWPWVLGIALLAFLLT